ncbi:MAG: DUF5663 domain-containing protein [Desulfoferrobacter sp.]
MNQERPLAPDLMKAKSAATVRNPYIVNFCKVLVEKKGEKLEPEIQKKMLDDMYRLFESMLGKNMIKALPEDLRKHYLSLTEDLNSLDYDKIGEVFDESISNYQEIMKDTMKQFAEIFMRNRKFDPLDYPVPIE